MQQGLVVRIKCPLDKVCEGIENNEAFRCGWYTHLIGENPQGGPALDEWRCAITWAPLLSTEIAQTNRGQTAAIESFRNELTKGLQLIAAKMLLLKNPEE